MRMLYDKTYRRSESRHGRWDRDSKVWKCEGGLTG